MKKAKGYPGHKNIFGLYHKIINQIPKHKFYYELFAGSAAIAKQLKLKNSNAKFFLNDIDKSVTDKLCCSFRKEEILNQDTIRIIIALIKGEADTDNFIFLDPPYLHSTRSNPKLYKYEMTDNDHKLLLKTILELKCNVMIIHPVCELYDTWLKDWRKVLIKVRYSNKTSLECLYMNYKLPGTLQTDSYLGKDCWDRQRIKRKAIALINKLSSLPELERNYVIQRVQEKFA